MSEVTEVFDVDQHYFEPADAFTRYIDPKFRRVTQWAEVGGRRHLLVAEKVVHAGIHPSHERVPRPGALSEYFRGNNPTGASARELIGELEPCRPEYQDRDARVAVMDAQGIERMVINPGSALVIEEALHADPPALYAVLAAFNRWLDDDWGFARDDRIVAPPVLSLVDPDRALAELGSVLERGAKMVMLRPGPVVGPAGSTSPAAPEHDRFWATVAEAGVPVAYHVADVGATRYAAEWSEGAKINIQALFSPFASILSLAMERPIFDTMAALVSQGLFARHPKLKVATIELGSGWVPELVRRMRIAYGQTPSAFPEDPVETLRRHVWVTPFQEDDMGNLVELIGPERVLYGSDWPHPEGVAEPLDLAAEFTDLPASDRVRIMSTNARELLGLS